MRPPPSHCISVFPPLILLRDCLGVRTTVELTNTVDKKRKKPGGQVFCFRSSSVFYSLFSRLYRNRIVGAASGFSVGRRGAARRGDRSSCTAKPLIIRAECIRNRQSAINSRSRPSGVSNANRLKYMLSRPATAPLSR